MHKILVHAQDSCARTRILCLVHVQESCACAAIASKTDVFLPKHVFSRMGSIWKMGRSSGRQNSSRGDARLFDVYDFSDKHSFPARGRFMIFQTVFGIFDEK